MSALDAFSPYGLITELFQKIDQLERNQRTSNEKIDRIDRHQRTSSEKIDQLERNQRTCNEKIDRIDRNQRVSDETIDRIERSQKTLDEKLERLTDILKNAIRENKKRCDSHDILLRRVIDKSSSSEQRKESEQLKVGPKTDPEKSNHERPPEKRARQDPTPSHSPPLQKEIMCPLCRRNPHEASKCLIFPDGITRQQIMNQRRICKKCAGPASHKFCPNEKVRCNFCPEYHLNAVCPVVFPKINKKSQKKPVARPQPPPKVLVPPPPPPPLPPLLPPVLLPIQQSTVQVRESRKRARSPSAEKSERREHEQSCSRPIKSRAPLPETPPLGSSDQNTPEEIVAQKDILLARKPSIPEPGNPEIGLFATLNNGMNQWHTFINYPVEPMYPIPNYQSCSTSNEGLGYFEDEPNQILVENYFPAETHKKEWLALSNNPPQPTNVFQISNDQSCSTDNESRGYFEDELMQVKEEEPEAFQ